MPPKQRQTFTQNTNNQTATCDKQHARKQHKENQISHIAKQQIKQNKKMDITTQINDNQTTKANLQNQTNRLIHHIQQH